LITVNTAAQVTLGSQEEVTVQVTVVDPPQAGGATPALFVKFALHPPDELAEASQVAKAASMAAWVWQAGSVWLAGQLSTTAGASSTVNTAEQLTSGSQEEVTVQVTVLDPPQASGAAPPLLEIAALQPPEKVAEANHAL